METGTSTNDASTEDEKRRCRSHGRRFRLDAKTAMIASFARFKVPTLREEVEPDIAFRTTLLK